MNKKHHLPHIDMVGYYQFVTFRTNDSIDDFLKHISQEDVSNSLKQYKADKYLDTSPQGAYLNGEALHWLKSFLLSKDGTLYNIVAFSIMPNHMHLLFKQKENIAITMKRIKGGSAFEINKILNRKGTLWEKGYFDKGIRDQEHFDMVYNYIANNAVKANLSDAQERFYGIYD